jgi:bisphosphoglycerate-dependent phosphoglycerate mutase
MQLISVTTLPEQKNTVFNTPLNNNISQNITIDLQLPATLEYTQPYWLKGTIGCTVADQENIIRDIIREVKVVFNVQINEVKIPFERTVVYKYNDNVKAMYNYLDVVPEVTTIS